MSLMPLSERTMICELYEVESCFVVGSIRNAPSTGVAQLLCSSSVIWIVAKKPTSTLPAHTASTSAAYLVITVTFHASPVERSSALLIAAPFVLMVAACTDGVNASEIGLSNDPRRGPVLAFGAVDAAGVPPHAAMSRQAASAHPSGPRSVLRIVPSFECGSVRIIVR